jgi:rhodanese-related sulfurtransferase
MSTPVDVNRVRELVGRGAQLVEVLPEAEYREEHPPGAINLPLERLDGRTAEAALDRARAVIVYCWDSL